MGSPQREREKERTRPSVLEQARLLIATPDNDGHCLAIEFNGAGVRQERVIDHLEDHRGAGAGGVCANTNAVRAFVPTEQVPQHLWLANMPRQKLEVHGSLSVVNAVCVTFRLAV